MNNNTLSQRPLVFLAIGLLNTLLDFGFYTFLSQHVFNNNSEIIFTGILSGTFALICAFLTHSYITWRGALISPKTLVKFVAFTGFGMWVIRPILLVCFMKLDTLFEWSHDLSINLGLTFTYDFVKDTVAFGLMVLLLLIYNYFVYSKFVFISRRTDQENR